LGPVPSRAASQKPRNFKVSAVKVIAVRAARQFVEVDGQAYVVPNAESFLPARETPTPKSTCAAAATA